MTLSFLVVFWSMQVLYGLVAAAQIYGRVFDKASLTKVATWGVWLGLGIHTVLVAWRWGVTGHVPTIGGFENALMGGWFIVAMTALAGWKNRYPTLAAAVLPFALLILAVGGMSDTSPVPFLASLQSVWLYIHIFFAWLAYGAYTVACGAGIVYLVKVRKPDASAENLSSLDELMFRTTVFGFITDAVMIAAGSIWAKKLWGSYWSWDPVETWSLLSWLVYGLALHLRTTMGWRGKRFAWVLVFAIIGVLISFWGVELVMGSSEHLFTIQN